MGLDSHVAEAPDGNVAGLRLWYCAESVHRGKRLRHPCVIERHQVPTVSFERAFGSCDEPCGRLEAVQYPGAAGRRGVGGERARPDIARRA